MGRDYTTVSRQVARLEELGLVTRRTNASDKRVKAAEITPRADLFAEWAAHYTGGTGQVALGQVLRQPALARTFEAIASEGPGYLYGGLIGAVIYKFLQDWLANLTPQYWQFWIGLVLVVIVLIGRERMAGWIASVRTVLARLATRLFPRSLALGPAAPDGR